MRNFLTRHVDLLLVLALCLFTLWPLLQQPGLPNGSDTLYHTYRVAEIDRSWSQGLLLPRWAEALYFGYGSPLFHYYASATYYVTSVLIRLTGATALDSLRLLIVLSTLLAGAGMHLFMRGRFGVLAGTLATVVYVYSPYIVYKEPYARGDFPELLAFAIFPWAMWRYDVLLRGGRLRDVALAAVSSGLLVITHNLMAVVLTGLLGAWVLWQGLTLGWRRSALGIGALLLGMGLTAYFWLPVLLERNAVQLDNLIAVAQLDYRNFFVPLDNLLAPVPLLDAGAVNGLRLLQNIGLVQWVLALTGFGISVALGAGLRPSPLAAPSPPAPLPQGERGFRGEGGHLAFPLFFGFMALALIFLVTPQSAFIWDAVGVLAFLQFPWRFLGPLAFCLAVLAGLNAVWIIRLPGRWPTITAAVLLVVTITAALPTLYITEWINTDVDTSVAAYHAAETSGKQLGTTFSSEFLPVTVDVLPDPTPRLLADYADGYPVNRVNEQALPAGVTVELREHGPQHGRWWIESETPFTLELLTFHFAGWAAEIDGQPVPVRASAPHGLMTLDVPAGQHEVHVYLGTTPPRTAGVLISLAALVVVGLVVWPSSPALRATPLPHGEGALTDLPPFSLREKGLRAEGLRAILIALIIQFILIVLLMRPGVMWLDSPPGTALAAQQATDYRLGESIRLLGYDLNSTMLRPGDRLELTLYWYTDAPIPYGYASFVHVSTGGPPLAQADRLNPGGRPTKQWVSDGYYIDPYVINLPPDMPPGEYQIFVGLYTCDTLPPGACGNGDRLPVTGPDGEPLGDSLPLTRITVS